MPCPGEGWQGWGAEGGLKVPGGWQRRGFPAPFSCLGSLQGSVKSCTMALASSRCFLDPCALPGETLTSLTVTASAGQDGELG